MTQQSADVSPPRVRSCRNKESTNVKSLSQARLSLRVKIAGAFALVLALMLALGVVAVVSLGSVGRSVEAVYRNGVAAEASLAAVGQLMNKLRKDQIHYMVVSPASRPGVRDDMTGDLSDMATAFRGYPGTTPAERRAFRGF